MSLLDLTNKRVCVTGGAGFLGRVVCEKLFQIGLPLDQLFVSRRVDFDLTHEADVKRLFDVAKSDVVVHLAAEVGGIGANRDNLGRFFYANMAMGLLCRRGHRGDSTSRYTGTDQSWKCARSLY